MPRDTEPRSDVARRLYALVTHVHSSCTSDLLDELRGGEHSLNQLRLLEHLRVQRRRDPSMKQVALMLRVSLPAATRLVDELDHRGLVDRYEDENDHRRRRVKLTERGREQLEHLAAARLAAIETFSMDLTPEEHAKLDEALNELAKRVEIQARTPPPDWRD